MKGGPTCNLFGLLFKTCSLGLLRRMQACFSCLGSLGFDAVHL